MPLNDGRADLVRRLVCTRGHVDVEHEWVVRFGYGAVEPWVRHVTDDAGDDAIRAIAGPDSLLLRGDRLPRADDHRHADRFTLQRGRVGRARADLDALLGPGAAAADHRGPDRRAPGSAGACGLAAAPTTGSYREAVVRSLLVLRMLTDSETGGIVAAAVDVPARGLRRRAQLGLPLLLAARRRHDAGGPARARLLEEATEWRDWLLRAVAGNPADLQIMYRVDGGRDLPERELDHLAGYAGPGRSAIGNAAVGQVQNDVLGEVMCALEMAREAGLAETDDSWSLQRHLVDHLLTRWREPDRGIWEVRGDPQHFTHSKVMAWAAVDRAVRAAEKHGLDAPVDRWRRERDAIHADVLAHAWDAERDTFVQAYGADAHRRGAPADDAGRLPAGGRPAHPPHPPRRPRRAEVAPGLLRRYRTEHTDDGVAGDEHAFLACSFWLADALARADDVDGSTEVLDLLIRLANDVGLLAEQYDPVGRRMAGNLPQALSHLALVRAVHSHDLALERAGR